MLRDARRGNAVSGVMMKSFTVTNEHLNSTAALISLGDLVRKLLGRHHRAWTPEERNGIDRLRRRFVDPYRARRWERLCLQGEW